MLYLISCVLYLPKNTKYRRILNFHQKNTGFTQNHFGFSTGSFRYTSTPEENSVNIHRKLRKTHFPPFKTYVCYPLFMPQYRHILIFCSIVRLFNKCFPQQDIMFIKIWKLCEIVFWCYFSKKTRFIVRYYPLFGWLMKEE